MWIPLSLIPPHVDRVELRLGGEPGAPLRLVVVKACAGEGHQRAEHARILHRPVLEFWRLTAEGETAAFAERVGVLVATRAFGNLDFVFGHQRIDERADGVAVADLAEG